MTPAVHGLWASAVETGGTEQIGFYAHQGCRDGGRWKTKDHILTRCQGDIHALLSSFQYLISRKGEGKERKSNPELSENYSKENEFWTTKMQFFTGSGSRARLRLVIEKQNCMLSSWLLASSSKPPSSSREPGRLYRSIIFVLQETTRNEKQESTRSGWTKKAQDGRSFDLQWTLAL